MPTTVTLKNLGAFAGATNLQLFLRKTSDNTLLAAGGDTGVDVDSIGSFAWTIAEDIPAEQLLARIYEGSTETAANIVIDSVLNVGFTEIGQEAAELNADTRVKLDATQPDYAPMKDPALRGDLTLAKAVDLILAGVLGVSSQPDADTELFKFVDAADAFTTTFDTAGNRAAVVLQ